MSRNIVTVLIVPLTLMMAAIPAAASTFLAMGPDQLVAKADSIVIGKVVSLESFWNDRGTVVLTEVVIEVEDILAGKAAHTVVVRTFGGTVGEITVAASGHPTFIQGERLLVFLTPYKDGTERVLGYRQGHFRIMVDEAGREIAVPTLNRQDGVMLLGDNGKPAPMPEAIPLEVVKQKIRECAKVVRVDQQ